MWKVLIFESLSGETSLMVDVLLSGMVGREAEIASVPCAMGSTVDARPR